MTRSNFFLGLSVFYAFTQFSNQVFAEPVHHFMYVGQDTDQLKDENFLNTPQFEGAQISYTWKHLEGNDKGDYDFSDIESDLATLNRAGKELFISLKDTASAPEKCLPKYLLKDPIYHGGVVAQHDDAGHATGVAARRWDPAVQERFHALIKALGDKFDGRIAGIRLSESALDIPSSGPNAPLGFTPGGYKDALKRNMLALKQAFPKTKMVIQHANFMPGDKDNSLLRELYLYGIEIGVGLGESDLMLDMKALAKGKLAGKPSHPAYQIMQEPEIKGKALIVIAAEDGNYLGKTGADEKPNQPWQDIVPLMDKFATENLNAQYIFWQHQEPFFTKNVLPFVKAQFAESLR